MNAFETLTLPHLPTYRIHLALFLNVRNKDFLRKQLMDSNQAFQYTFLDAAMIYSRLHLLAALFEGINALAQGRLRTHNVHSDVVFALSPGNNIAESFKRFGITASCRDIIAVKITTSEEGIALRDIARHLLDNVQAEEVVGVTDERLRVTRDLEKLKKVYKTTTTTTRAGLDEKMLWDIIGSMALSGT